MNDIWPLSGVCFSTRLPSGLIGRHIAQAQLMHLCLTAVKTSMLVLQRSQDATSAALQVVEGPCSLQSTLGSLLDRYVDILTNGMGVSGKQTQMSILDSVY